MMQVNPRRFTHCPEIRVRPLTVSRCCTTPRSVIRSFDAMASSARTTSRAIRVMAKNRLMGADRKFIRRCAATSQHQWCRAPAKYSADCSSAILTRACSPCAMSWLPAESRRRLRSRSTMHGCTAQAGTRKKTCASSTTASSSVYRRRSPNACAPRKSCARHRRWRSWGSSPAGWRTISTICSRPSLVALRPCDGFCRRRPVQRQTASSAPFA